MNDVILHLTAGQGPQECRWVISKLIDIFGQEATAEGLAWTLVEIGQDNPASLLLSIRGQRGEAFAAARTGSIRWIGHSPYRPKCRRKNWYVGVKRAPTVEDLEELKNSDIRYQAIRASGPGGQHVNKTDSAVRATHIPTGLSSVSQDQRSQVANKKIALLKLALIFEERREMASIKAKQKLWRQNKTVERGNEIRCYEGSQFTLRH